MMNRRTQELRISNQEPKNPELHTSSFLVLLFCLLLAGSGCGLLTSDTRAVKRQVKVYGAALSRGSFEDAAKFYAKGFVWIRGKTKHKKNAGAAFNSSIKGISNRTDVIVHVSSIRKLADKEYLVLGKFQVRCTTTREFVNWKWNYSMTWVKSEKGWKIKEVKEKGERKRFRS